MPKSISLLIVLSAFASTGLSGQNRPARSLPNNKNACDHPASMAQMDQCSLSEYHKADLRLGALYGRLRDLLKRDLADASKTNDAERKAYSETEIQKLTEAQNAWLRYRDLQCSAAKQQFDGGTMGPPAWASCMTEVTNHRMEELKEVYDTLHEKFEKR